MKIVEIIPNLDSVGGAETFFISLCKSIKDGNELFIILLYECSPNHLLQKIEELVPKQNIFFCKKKRGIDFKASRKLKKIINSIEPDIIHSHLSVILTYFLAFGFRRHRWEFVHTLHSVPSKEGSKPQKVLLKELLKRKLITIVGISDEITNQGSKMYHGPLETIYNGVVLEKLAKSDSKSFDFVCVARFSEEKNHKMLFDCFHSFLNKHPKASLLLLGGGELQDFYIKYVKKEGISKNVFFKGTVTNVGYYLDQSKFFVLSSTYEGNPISVLEAMNHGLPVLLPNVGGIPDVVSDPSNGRLFEVNNMEQMLVKMEELYSLSEDEYEEISKRNMEEVQKYSIENCAKQYLELFEKLISSK